ncbi:MAG: hypothetical protein HYW16_02600 [Candidatus Rokubacteria bacterium]|nr:hypothetical protein [Candidatus Rokubacteria bacterium]
MARRLLAALGVLLMPAVTLRPLPALLHVHSTLSTGDLPLDRLLAEARAQGLEAVLLSENYLLRVEYGLWPFRRATRVTRQEPSVLSRGVEAYLAQVAEARRQFPEMLLVPGVEVIPRYYWTGTPFTGDLTVHDLQKNLLVFGIADAAALKRLPSAGNPYLGRYTLRSLVEILPGLLVLPGLWLILVPRRRLRRLGPLTIVERQRRWLLGTPLVVLGLVALVRAFPFTEDPWSPYGADSGLVAHQALIDEVESRGGVTVWSFPEARDSSESGFLGLRVRVRTDPYLDDLVRTFRYTAFGAVYEDTTRVATPGGMWDYVLGKYLSGERSRAPWVVGESGFHGFLGGKRFGGIQTVFLVSEKSEAALLSSFSAGRMYSLSRTPAYALTLRSFTVHQGDREAGSGETLQAAATGPLEVRVGVDASDGGEYPVRALLVRNGQVVQLWMGKTPLRVMHREVVGAGAAYYRLEVRGTAPHQILSNPVFVRPAGAAR